MLHGLGIARHRAFVALFTHPAHMFLGGRSYPDRVEMIEQQSECFGFGNDPPATARISVSCFSITRRTACASRLR